MAAQSRLTLLTAALVASVLSPAASAQASLDRSTRTRGRSVRAFARGQEARPRSAPVRKTGREVETPSTNSVESAAPVASELHGPGGVGREGGRAVRSKRAGLGNSEERSEAPPALVASRSIKVGRQQPLRTARAPSNPRFGRRAPARAHDSSDDRASEWTALQRADPPAADDVRVRADQSVGFTTGETLCPAIKQTRTAPPSRKAS